MPSAPKTLILWLLPLLTLSGCDFNDTGSSSGPPGTTSSTGSGSDGGGGGGMPGYVNGGGGLAGTQDTVIATPSVAGPLSVTTGANQTVSVTFTSSDQRPMTGLAVSGTTLPSAWTGLDHYSCTLIGAGRSCVLTLSYAPTAADSGTLTVNYIYIDNANEPKAPGGSVTIPYASTSANNVAAVVSPTGQVSAVPHSGNQSVSINFTTDDGNAATALTLTSNLTALPDGWSSAATAFSCAIVSSGSGCQLLLGYAPTAAASGILTLNYSYTDDSGAPKTGALNIPYSTTTDGNVVASVAPTGQVNAVEKTGSQAVTVNFTTDDGKPATELFLLTDPKSLPAGWSGQPTRFSCASVSTGNGCQLPLNYAPAAAGRGTLSLNYGYLDAAGTFNVGTVNVAYAATTNDNVVGTASPSGQINAIVGSGSQPVAVTFTTDDGRPATALQLTSSLATLPAGWSSSDSTFTCSGLSSGSGCQLPLMYTPTAAASGSLTLTYSYVNNAGEPKTGSLNVPYRATTDDNVVGTPSQSPLAVLVGSNTTVNVTFTTDDGNPASALVVTSDLSSLPSGWSSAATSFSCSSMSVGTGCQLALAYAPTTTATGTLTLGFSYLNNSGITKSGTVAIPYTASP